MKDPGMPSEQEKEVSFGEEDDVSRGGHQLIDFPYWLDKTCTNISGEFDVQFK
jgi:hypothetical protein